MQTKLSKAEIVGRIQAEHDQLEQTVAALSRRDLTRRDVTDKHWSVKDILAHLMDWEQRFLGWYQAGVRGEVPETPAPGMTWSWENLHRLNEQGYRRHRRRAWEDVLVDYHRSYEQVVATIRAIPEEEIHAARRYAWTKHETLADYIRANTYGHCRWANDLIRHWVKKQQRKNKKGG